MRAPLTDHLHHLLGHLPDAACAVLDQTRLLAPHPGEPLLRAGERWQHLWWIESGCFRLYYLDRKGQASNKNFHLDGAMLWPLTPDLVARPVDFWVEALEPARVWSVPWAAWRKAIGEEPSWRALEHTTLTALLQDKMRREQAFLQCSATERYQSLLNDRPEWVTRIPLRHLASYLGMTDVALSRIRRRLRHAPPRN